MVKDFGKVKLTIDGEWDINSHYDTLCIVVVKDGINRGSYCSKIEVPVGTDITNELYWQKLYFSDGILSIDILQELGVRIDAVVSQNAINNEFYLDRTRLSSIENNLSTVTTNLNEAIGNINLINAEIDQINSSILTITNQLASISNTLNGTREELSVVKSVIPNTASSSNKLADVNFVNSSIATNTATFRGLYESVNDLPTSGIINNDYAFVIETVSGNPEYVRYKYNGTSWVREYVLNNSSYTAEQWAAINSGITANLLSQINTLAQNALPSLVSGYKCTFMTLAAYNALTTKDATTLYIITD